MKETPFVSIIVPVYKAEQCLARCVDSILWQTINNWELLLIDDGSPDNSGVLCDKYAEKDERIKAFHKENGGVSSARNLGLEKAQGEYVTFIDADDYVSEDYIEKMAACASADLIICGFTNEGETTFKPDAVKIEDLNNNNPFLYTLFEVPYYLDTPWCKLFKNEILRQNKLSFDRKLKLSEDTLFCYQFVSKIHTISVVPDSLYTYDGQWGGESKYQLSYDELSYMLKSIVESINSVNTRFNSKIDSKYKCFHISKLIGLFAHYTDHKIFELYHQYHPEVEESVFLGDYGLSPLVVGVLQAQELVRNGNRKESLFFLKQLSVFSTIPVAKIHFQSYKHTLFFMILKYLGPKSAYCLLLL